MGPVRQGRRILVRLEERGEGLQVSAVGQAEGVGYPTAMERTAAIRAVEAAAAENGVMVATAETARPYMSSRNGTGFCKRQQAVPPDAVAKL